MIELFVVLAGVPAPPECPWRFGGFDILMPSGNQSPIPLNASFWIRDYGMTAFSVGVVGSTRTVDADEIVTELSSTGGRLVELRPRALLEPGALYEVRADPVRSSPIVAGTDVDDLPPQVPVVTSVHAIADPYTVCPSAGVIIDVEDVAEPVIHLMEDAGATLEIGTSGYAFPRPNRVVPTEPNAAIRFTVVAMDLAGNRSDATPPIDAMAGAMPMVVGKLPSPNPPTTGDGRERPGCSCRAADPSASLVLFFVLALAVRLHQR